MKSENIKMFFIKFPYWLGIGADVLWAIGLLFPDAYACIMGLQDFNPDFTTMQIMRIGGVMMIGWTVILLWAVNKPVENRFVILITACPIVVGSLYLSV